MIENTKKMILKALDTKIKDTEKRLTWRKNILKDAQNSFKTKKGSTMPVGTFSATFEYSESYAEKQMKEMPPIIERLEKNLKGYKDAKNDIINNY